VIDIEPDIGEYRGDGINFDIARAGRASRGPFWIKAARRFREKRDEEKASAFVARCVLFSDKLGKFQFPDIPEARVWSRGEISMGRNRESNE